MSKELFLKYQYDNLKDLELLENIVKPNLELAIEKKCIAKQIKGNGYTTLGIVDQEDFIFNIKENLPNWQNFIDSKIELVEYFFDKKIKDFYLKKFFSNICFNGTTIDTHWHGSKDKPVLVFVFYIYSEPDSGNLILQNDSDQVIISSIRGDLIIHPGYIPHSVSEYKGNIPRLSLISEFHFTLY